MAAAKQLDRDVRELGDVLHPVWEEERAVEVRAQTDVVDSCHPNDVFDVIDAP